MSMAIKIENPIFCKILESLENLADPLSRPCKFELNWTSSYLVPNV